MLRVSVSIAAAVLAIAAIRATRSSKADAFARGFSSKTLQVGGRTVHYRIGGKGPTVLLLHGYGETGDMWAPLARSLAKDHRVVVPDLPGLGKSRPEGPAATYDAASVARVLRELMQKLRVDQVAIVGHDIGLMVAYAYAAQFPNEIAKLALMDAPIPGVGPWQQVLLMPGIWHFHFNGAYAEKLTAGRERIYLDRVWDDFAFHPERITEETRRRYAASYAQPGNMRAGFSYFAAFSDDANDNVKFAETPLKMPVLAMGGEQSFGALMPAFASAVATNVESSVIPDSGHWLMEENPQATSDALIRFLSDSERPKQ